jgi:titin
VLTWTVPPDGGSQIGGYNVYRGTSATSQPLLIALGDVTTYTDTSTTSRVRYFYAVSAVNANGEGPRSNVIRVRAR